MVDPKIVEEWLNKAQLRALLTGLGMPPDEADQLISAAALENIRSSPK